jgi:hypothetical protein
MHSSFRPLWAITPTRPRQRAFAFRERSERLERAFKWAIVGLTLLVGGGLLTAVFAKHDRAARLAYQARRVATRALGSAPDRTVVEAHWQRWRRRWTDETRLTLRQAYDESGPRMQQLLRFAGLDPDHAVIRWGNYDWTLLLPATVFAPDDTGRSYRLRPSTRSVWLRGVKLRQNMVGFFLVPDTPELVKRIEGTGAWILPGSVQTTSSWGLRGPEPDLNAPLRGLVLGDSNAQGMLLGDDETPVACLQRELERRLATRVSLLNTGHIGYSPEQFYYTLLEYGDRFQPHFVLLTLCMNDFGGKATATDEGLEDGRYWIGRISQYCRDHGTPCYIASFPLEAQVTSPYQERSLPGVFSEPSEVKGLTYCDPVESLADAHLRLMIDQERRAEGTSGSSSPLYNSHLGDNHFSAEGAAVWAKAVGRRVALLVELDQLGPWQTSIAPGRPAEPSQRPPLQAGSPSQAARSKS